LDIKLPTEILVGLLMLVTFDLATILSRF